MKECHARSRNYSCRGQLAPSSETCDRKTVPVAITNANQPILAKQWLARWRPRAHCTPQPLAGAGKIIKEKDGS